LFSKFREGLMNTTSRYRFPILTALVLLGMAFTFGQTKERTWLAGDSHIHSHWSPGYDRSQDPPEPIKGAEGIYSTPTNAQRAKQYGLTWMSATLPRLTRNI
jgi:hypothetical protein